MATMLLNRLICRSRMIYIKGQSFGVHLLDTLQLILDISLNTAVQVRSGTAPLLTGVGLRYGQSMTICGFTRRLSAAVVNLTIVAAERVTVRSLS